MLELVLVISVVLQFAAAFLALRLIWITEGRKAWVFIAIAVSLMGLRRAITLARLLAGDLTKPPDLVAEMVALVISILMIFGIVWIAPLFRRLRTSEAELRDSRRMLYSTLDAIPIGVEAKDRDGKYLVANKAMAGFYGQTPQAMIGKNFSALGEGTDEQKAIIAQDDRQVLENGITVGPQEEELILQNGKKIWWRKTKIPLRGETGEVVGLVGILEDVTKRKEAFEASMRNERMMKKAEQVAHIGSLEIDRVTNKQYWSDEVWRIMGLEPQSFEPNEKTFASLLHPEDKKRVLAAINDTMEGREPFDLECRIVRPDGNTRMLHAQGEIILGGLGEPLRMVGYIHDITENMQMQVQLRQSQKMEAIGTLAGGIAHDFNNILQPILLFSELLRPEIPAASQGNKFLEQITRSALRAKDLIAKILLYSKQGEPLKTPSDLRTVAEEVIGLMQSTLPKSITLELVSSDDLPLVLCDPSQIHQVMLNICINGSHAITGQGKLIIELSRVELEGVHCVSGNILDQNHLRIAISDTGKGMKEETVQRIFDPFFTTKEVGQGTGMGLSSALGIVQSFGGGIAVSTELGKGSTFEIFLPAFAGGAKESPVSRSVTGGTEAILFVDDEEAIAEGWQFQLERLGYHVTAFLDGSEALRGFKENPDRFALVITDLSMPGMNGDTLIHEIRKIRPEIPVILCTGLAESLNPETVRATGINACLGKPLDVQELGRAIREILDGAKTMGT